MSKTGWIVGAFALVVLAPALQADDRREAVESAVGGFVHAFTSLDWARFRAAFTEDATVFLFPMAERTTVERSFGPLFERIRQQTAKDAPPYFTLEPRDVAIQVHGAAAIVTFHLQGRRPGQVGRRTLVMVLDDGAWRIAHLHASFGPIATSIQ